MIITNKIKNNEVYLGINNHFLEMIFVHPWGAFLISYVFISLIILFNSNIDKVKHFSLIGLPVCLISLFIAMIYHKNSCYKLIINMVTKEVSISLMFNRKVVVEDANVISIEIGREVKLIANKNRYKIFTEILHDVVSYLPPNTKIIYKGFFGKQFKKELEKNNKPLTPGKYF